MMKSRTLNQFILPKGILFSLPWLLNSALSRVLFITTHTKVACLALGKEDVWVSVYRLALLFGAFVCARSFGMGVNRIVDRKIDQANPRTKNRLLCKNPDSLRIAKRITALFLLGYISLSALLGSTLFYLSFLGASVIALYSYMKRISWLCHLFLGAVQAFGVLVAYYCADLLLPSSYFVTNAFLDSQTLLLNVAAWLWALALAFSMAGADIIYSLSDWQFDTKHRLYSIPVTFGPKKAQRIAVTFLSFALVFVFAVVTLWSFVHARNIFRIISSNVTANLTSNLSVDITGNMVSDLTNAAKISYQEPWAPSLMPCASMLFAALFFMVVWQRPITMLYSFYRKTKTGITEGNQDESDESRWLSRFLSWQFAVAASSFYTLFYQMIFVMIYRVLG